MLKQAGLVNSSRHGQWIFFRSDEEAIHKFSATFNEEILKKNRKLSTSKKSILLNRRTFYNFDNTQSIKNIENIKYLDEIKL